VHGISKNIKHIVGSIRTQCLIQKSPMKRPVEINVMMENDIKVNTKINIIGNKLYSWGL
jgi:hypothetical protein